jgi:hypothetical protein
MEIFKGSKPMDNWQWSIIADEPYWAAIKPRTKRFAYLNVLDGKSPSQGAIPDQHYRLRQ